MSIVTVRPRPRTLLAAALALAVLASLAFTARADAVVYYVSGGNIARANIDGTNRVAVIGSQGSPAGIAINDTHIYWTRNNSGGAGDVRRARLDGTNVEVVVAGLTNPQSVALDGTYVYYGQSGGVNLIGRAKLDGSEANNSFITGSTTPNGLAVNGTHIYWSNYLSGTTGTIGRANIDGTEVNQSFITGTGLGGPNALAINSTHVFWGNFGNATGTTIGRANLDGTGKNGSFMTTGNATRGLAATETHLYWSNFGFGNGNSYGRAPLDGSSPANQSFITPASGPHGLAVNSMRGTSNVVTCAPTTPRVTRPTTCTATVTDTDVDAGSVPTGTVTFSSTGGGTFGSEGTCTLVESGAEQASCSIEYTPSAQGADTVAALSSGDSVHAPTRGTQVLTVGAPPNPTTTSVACAPSDPSLGTATSCTATVTDGEALPITPTGDVSFGSSGDGTFTPAASCTLAETATGSASCTVSYIPGAEGAQTITGSYGGDADHADSSGEGALDVQPAPPHPTATTVACDPGDVRLTRSTTCTVTVSDTAPVDQSTPSDTVTLTGTGTFDPAASCTLAQESPGVATCSVEYTPNAQGSDTVSASYAGNVSHEPSSGEDTITVGPPPRITSTTLACTPEAFAATRVTTCVVTVTDTSASPVAPPGSVELSNTGTGQLTPATSCTLAATGTAVSSCEFTYKPTAQGAHTVGATYADSAEYAGSDAEESLTVGPEPHDALLNLDCDPRSLNAGTASTCTAVVFDADAVGHQPVVGTVTFATESNGTFAPTTCTLAPIADDRSSCSVPYTPNDPGVHTVSATFFSTEFYRGDRGVASVVATAPQLIPPADEPVPPPPGPGPIVTPPPPSNAFTLGKLKLSRAKGRAVLPVRVPGAGRILLGGRGVRDVSRSASKAGVVRIAVVPKGKTRKRLLKKGRLRVRVRLTFTPQGGSTRGVTRNVTLKYTKPKGSR